jgi:Protein of unknwon function (DUF3310)
MIKRSMKQKVSPPEVRCVGRSSSYKPEYAKIARQARSLWRHHRWVDDAVAKVLKHDTVNHPAHYNAHPSGVECIDVVEHMSFNVDNAIKYFGQLTKNDTRSMICAKPRGMCNVRSIDWV